MAANKETRIVKSNTLEQFRQKSNEISLHLGDNEQLGGQFTDKVYNLVDVSAGSLRFFGNDDNSKTIRFELKPEESLDNTAGYLILNDVTSLTGFAVDATISQTGGFSATVVSSTNEKILLTNTSGTYNTAQDITDNSSNTIAAANHDRVHSEGFSAGVVRVYKNNVELNQDLSAGGFHVATLAARLNLTGTPDVSEVTEGTVLNQSGGFSGTVLHASATQLLFKSTTGSFSASTVLRFPDNSTAIAVAKFSGSLVSYDTAYGNAIELNTPASANDDIKIFSANLVDALNELQSDIGSVESLTTTATTLQGAINEHDAELGTITAGAMGTTASTVSGAIAEHETQIGNVNINTIASGNNTITGALTQLHTEVGSLSLNTSANDLTAAVNEIEGVFDASAHEISAGSNTFTINSGAFTINSSGDIVLDADGADVLLKDNGTLYGSLTNSAGNLVIKSGSTTMLTGSGANATFAGTVTAVGTSVFTNLDISGNVDIDGSLETDALSINGTTVSSTASELNILDGATLDVNELNILDGATLSTSELNILDGVTASATDINLIDGITNGTVIASKAIITDSNKDITGGRNITISGELEASTLDVNGVADISGNLTIGTLATNSQHVKGAIAEHEGDIGNMTLTGVTATDLSGAVRELAAEAGAIAFVSGGPADTANPTNLTSAVNAIDAEVGDTSYNGSDITSAISTAQTNIGTIGSLATSAGNLVSAVNELHGEVNTNATNISSNDTDIATINTNIGSLGSLTTSVNSSIVNAINSVENEVDTTQANIGTINTNIGTIGNLATSANALVTAINELHGEINSNDTDIGNLQTGKISLSSGSSQTIASNLSFTGSGKTLTFASGTTLDVSAATLTIGGGGGTLNFNTAFVELDVDSNQQGIKVKRETITGVSNGSADAQLRWNEGISDQSKGWEVVYPNATDDGGSVTTSLVTFENAKRLISDNVESAINVTFDDTNNNYDFQILTDNNTIEVGSGNLQLKNNGITSGKLASDAVTTAKIAASAVTGAKIANTTIGNTKLVNKGISIDAQVGTTHLINLGETLSINGSSNEIETSINNNVLTIGLPNDVTIGNDLTIDGDLIVNGTTTTINTANLDIEDTTVRFAKNANTLSATNGAGLEFGASASKPTILWDNGNTRLTTNKEFHSSVGFTGAGTNLTSLNASNISSGTINDARLPSTITSNITGNVNGNVTGNVTGNASTATALATSRNFSITGDITASNVSFNGTGAVVLDASIDANTVGTSELNVTGTAGDGKAITYQSGALQWSSISTTDTNTKYVINTVDSGNNAIIRLTSTGDDSGVTDDITLAAGSNITITESGDTITINSTDTNTQLSTADVRSKFSAGNLIDIASGQINVDLTELALETADVAGTDHLVYIDSGSQKKIAFSNVNLSAFDNSASGFTTNTGTVSSLSDLSITSTATELNKLDGFTGAVADLNYAKDLRATGVTSTEFDRLDGVTSSIQNQLNSKLTSTSNLNASNLSSGTIASARLPSLAVSDFGGAAIQLSSESFSDSDTVLMTAKAIDDRIDGKGFTSNTGDITSITITAGEGLSGNVTTNSGAHNQTINLDHLGIEDLTDPNDDRIAYWDDSAQSFEWLDIGTNLSITSGGVLNAANTNIATNLGNSRTATTVDITSSDGNNTTLSGATASLAGVMTASQVTTLNGLVSDTGIPAITSNGSSPSLNSGISAAEVRSEIGAGTMSSWTLTDADSATESIGNGETINLADSAYVNLRITGSANARNIQASLNTSFLAFKSFKLNDSGGNLISTITADNQQDIFTFKEGNLIDLTSSGDTLTIATTAEVNQNAISTINLGTYSSGGGGGTDFTASSKTDTYNLRFWSDSFNTSVSGDQGFITLDADQRGEIQSIGYNSSNTIHTDNGYISFRTNSADRFKMESDGDFHATGDVVAYSTTPSDERLKENIQVVDGALEKVSQLKGVTFDWKKDGKHSAGLIAQDVEKVLPTAVKEKELSLTHDDGEKYKVIENSQITSLLVEAIKELKEQNIELKAEVEKLKSINSNS